MKLVLQFNSIQNIKPKGQKATYVAYIHVVNKTYKSEIHTKYQAYHFANNYKP